MSSTDELTDSQRKALATIKLAESVGSNPHIQVGELERLRGMQPQDDELVECWRCTLKHPRKQWRECGCVCPFCGRTKLEE